EQTPGLVDTDVANEIRHPPAAVGVVADKTPDGSSNASNKGRRDRDTCVEQRRTVELCRIIHASGGRHAVAELPSVLDVVRAGDRVVAADQERGVVAGITVPGRCVRRGRLTEGKAGELEEHVLNRDIAVARAVKQGRVEAAEVARRGGYNARVRRPEVVVLPVDLTEGANDAIFGGSAGIKCHRHTRTGMEIVDEAIALATIAGIERLTVNAAVGR